jgi:hypothetical protein
MRTHRPDLTRIRSAAERAEARASLEHGESLAVTLRQISRFFERVRRSFALHLVLPHR